MFKYFDAYFYLANWGSLRLMFRFPKGLIDEADILPYCVDEYITFETIGKYQVLDLDFNPEYGGEWLEEEDANLSYFVRLRADLLDGDYRLLYLAWLKAMTFYGDPNDEEYEDDGSEIAEYDREPPIPPGLKKLTPSLENFAQVFKINHFMVEAAAEASPDIKNALAVNYRELIERLPREECEDFLVRLAEGDPGVGLALRKRLGAYLSKEPSQPAGRRSIQWLLQRAEQLEKTEENRRAEADRQKHIAEMETLAAREAQVWGQVERTLDTGRKIASVYNDATALLEKLYQLAEVQNTRDVFRARLRQLAEKYASRPSLIERWRIHGWL